MCADKKLADHGAILYDLESIARIPNGNEEREPDLYYCRGWDDYAGMGISINVVYDFVEARYKFYLKDNMDEFRKLVDERNIVIGFCNEKFDNKLIEAVTGIHISPNKSYDLWSQIVATQGGPGGKMGFTMNDLLIANGIEVKTGRGIDAPRLAQEARWGELINYCYGDVEKTVQLLRMACSDVLVNPNRSDYLVIKKPWEAVVAPARELF